eukprot:CAMPEP_0183520862 /NCGR_PEP_ID=MMETSP0371-20130417/17246_1 /TAXON_ID=268820 /ORGANISM="Peridinium aciculiferum, Strain PAER-2" /LENGTH=115 /DNA_ID=CAMNT_0025719301 /DNA_START=384 /DNA_END=728 /DNA_ORIENTATION=+
MFKPSVGGDIPEQTNTRATWLFATLPLSLIAQAEAPRATERASTSAAEGEVEDEADEDDEESNEEDFSSAWGVVSFSSTPDKTWLTSSSVRARNSSTSFVGKSCFAFIASIGFSA